MTDRELKLFLALTDVGDDLVLESGAFVPILSVGGASAVGKASLPSAAGVGKRPLGFFPAVAMACVAVVIAVAILVGVLGQALGLFDETVTETAAETAAETADMTAEDTKEPTRETGEDPTEDPTEYVTEDPTEDPTEAPTERSEETSAEVTVEVTTEEESKPASDYVVDEQEYGLPFTVLYCSDTFDKGYDLGLTDGSASALSEASCRRTEQAERHLGVKISAVDGGSGTSCSGKFLTASLAGADEYQCILTHSYKGVISMMTSACLLDLKGAEGLSLDAAYWESDQNEKLTVSGKQLVAYNEFLLPDGYVLGFDRSMVKQVFDDGDLYALVESKGWTLEAMASCVTAFGDGSGDRYGLSCAGDMPLAAFVTSSDMRVLKHTGDRITLAAMDISGRGAAVDALLYGLSESWELYAYDPEEGHTPIRMGSGQVAFEAVTLRELLRNGGGGTDVGILPYPLFDRSQTEYRTLYVGGYMAVPNTVKHRAMVWDVLEVLAYESLPVRRAYLDAVFAAGGCTSPKDRTMLELVEASMTVEQGLALMDVHPRMEALMTVISNHIAGDGAYEINVPYLWSQISKKLDDLVRTVGSLSDP